MTEPITTDIILQLMVVAFVMVLFSLLLNKILGVKPSKMKETRDKARNLRERVRQAEILGDSVLMQQLQVETMQMMRDMLKKQLLPLVIRCVIFIGIYIVIGMVYGQYENWFWIYFLFSFSFSMISLGLKYGFKKITGKEDKRKSFAKEIMTSIYPAKRGQSFGLNLPGHSEEEFKKTQISHELADQSKEEQEIETSDDWKDRIQN